MPQLQDNVAVITGAGSGLGRACARRFSAEGAVVVVADINLESASQTAAELEATGGTAHAVKVDASTVVDNETLFRTAMDKYGRVDVVVAAAGVSHSGYESGAHSERETRDLLDQPVESWQRVLDVNLTGVMLANQLGAKAMIESGHGRGSIINIASVAGRVPLRGAADYCVSKAGVVMLTKAFALEALEHGIRVNAIGPGFIETPMTQRMNNDPEGAEMMRAMTPMGRLGVPEEIANTALFLASDESSYIAGQTIFPAGGMFTG